MIEVWPEIDNYFFYEKGFRRKFEDMLNATLYCFIPNDFKKKFQ